MVEVRIMEEIIKIIKAVILGHAVGDALGVPVEFEDREKLQKHPITDMQGFGTYPMPAGSWSDDTSMSLCALEAMCHENWSWDMIMNNFAFWLENGDFTPIGETFDVGRTCLEAIVRYKRDNLPAKECGCDGEWSNGNGSLMRIHPFVLYGQYALLNGTNDGYWSWMALIKQASALTHAHDRSVMACYIYSYVLSFLLKEPTRESLKAGLKFAGEDLDYLPEFEHYERIFKPDVADLPESEIKSSGYVVDTLEAALWCLLTTDSYKDCILRAVNLGGDTDTVAAIAGGLAGALYGYDSIPVEWRNTLIKREYIEEMCEKAASAWYIVKEKAKD
jgi:ADP-ribosylglycohydrolase